MMVFPPLLLVAAGLFLVPCVYMIARMLMQGERLIACILGAMAITYGGAMAAFLGF